MDCRSGARRLAAMLVREGLRASHKRVHRLYREEGLAMRIRQRRRTRWSRVATRRNQRKPEGGKCCMISCVKDWAVTLTSPQAEVPSWYIPFRRT